MSDVNTVCNHKVVWKELGEKLASKVQHELFATQDILVTSPVWITEKIRIILMDWKAKIPCSGPVL